MRVTRPTTEHPATRASGIAQDHPVVAVTNAFAALEGLADERPELAPELQRALAGLQDVAWIARSRIFDGCDRSALRRALERVSIAVSIVSARRADMSPAGDRRLRHALGMLAATVQESLAMLAHAGTETREYRANHPAPPSQHVTEEQIDAAEGPLDRAA
jgi:hypothetical protein